LDSAKKSGQVAREREGAMVEWEAEDEAALPEAVWEAADWAVVVDLAAASAEDPQPASVTI
jgi:hypothetical protein